MLKSVTTSAGPPQLVVRPGDLHDLELVAAMHGRCSDLSLYRRFHAPLPGVSTRMVRSMLAPTAGWSVLVQQQGDAAKDDIVGFACAAPVSDSQVEVGLLVEDRQQRNGVGTRLLHTVAVEASARGYESIQCLAQPDNHAVLSTVRRAGLIGRVAWRDDLLQVSIPVRRLSDSDLPRTA